MEVIKDSNLSINSSCFSSDDVNLIEEDVVSEQENVDVDQSTVEVTCDVDTVQNDTVNEENFEAVPIEDEADAHVNSIIEISDADQSYEDCNETYTDEYVELRRSDRIAELKQKKKQNGGSSSAISFSVKKAVSSDPESVDEAM